MAKSLLWRIEAKLAVSIHVLKTPIGRLRATALIEEGEPVLGVVLAPALELLYWAVKGGGAWREERSGPPQRLRYS